MSEYHKRATSPGGPKRVLVLSGFYHKMGENEGRKCECGAVWTVMFSPRSGEPHVWKNSQQHKQAVLDWSGNSVAVECCDLLAPPPP
jgi:hypothetical protein